MALKANHPHLAHKVQEWFDENRDTLGVLSEVRGSSRTEAGHHRIETRQLWQIPVSRVLGQDSIEKWDGLQTLVIEESHRRLWNKETHATRFFISSLPADDPESGDCIRSHWGVENQLHWCLDVILKEDDSRLREGYAPRNMSILRRMSLTLLRQKSSKMSLKMKRYKAGLDNSFLLKILADSNLC